jgi:multidrug efflux pump subunit AcrA (membrane-fusion protein)
LLFLPLWRDREDAFFVIEPAHSHVIYASVPGRVNAVMVKEGESVRAGQPLLRMNSYMADAMRASAIAETGTAKFQTVDAELHGQSIGTAAAEENAATHSTKLAREAQSSLDIGAPVDGTVLTSNPSLLVDQDVASGQLLLDLADAGPRTVRVFIPSSALDRIPRGAEVALALPGQFSILRLALAPPGSDPVELPPGLVSSQKYQGIRMAVFYCARMTLPPATGNPMFGLSGEAKIFGQRRSFAERVLTAAFDLAKAHLW